MSTFSNLFFSTNTEKETLHKRIIPTDAQQESQQERWSDLTDFLKDELNTKTKLQIESWLQGSYKFSTQIRPASKFGDFDIDLGIYFKTESDREDLDFSPKELKSKVQEAIEEYAKDLDDELEEVVSPPKERCCRIKFTNNFHIDVPVYHLNASSDKRSLATEKDIWEDSDPKEIYEWFKNNSGEDEVSKAKTRRIVRYIKMWAQLKFQDDKERPSTIMLTVLTVNAVNKIVNFHEIDDDDLLKLCLNDIYTELSNNKAVDNPVDTNEDLNRMTEDGFQNLLTELDQFISVSDRALTSTFESECAVIWQEAFEHFFPMPELLEENNKDKALIPLSFDPRVSIVATPETNNNRQWTGVNEIGPIPRECLIKFNLANKDQLPEGSRVEWVVRNEGKDAEEENDLGHNHGMGTDTVEKGSAYNGTHYMDVVVKNYLGQPIGIRRIKVVINGHPYPARTPKRKPGWKRIANKKR
jgi:hypothetical protein